LNQSHRRGGTDEPDEDLLAANPLFVGRGEELLRVAAALEGGDTTVALGQVVASTGLGGLGKTQLAVEFVHRYGRFFAGGVFWLSFASADEIPLQVAACAGPGFESRSVEERVRLVKDGWQGATPRLLVFDNCEEEGLLEAWRPPSGGCRVLVTSRRSRWSPTLGVTALPLDLLPRADSIELLRRYRPDLASDDPGLDAIARELGDLPLALHLAASYLRAYRAEVSLDDYLAELRRSEVVRHASLLGAGVGDSPSPTHHVQSVAQTFALCLGRLDREHEVDRAAIALLARMAWMAPGEVVPRGLLDRTLGEVEPLRRADGLRRLAEVGLVEEGDGWLRLHRLLVRFARQAALDPEAQPDVDRALIECGEDAEECHLNGPALAAVIPHLVEAASRVTGNEQRQALLSRAAGQAWFRTVDPRGARQWLERSLVMGERAFGPDHPETAVTLNSFSYVLMNLGELSAARPLMERALAIREAALGDDHPDTAESLDTLGILHGWAGRQEIALALHERALAITERALGPDHLDTARSVNNLAMIHWKRGEHALARSLFERALAVMEKLLGFEHPEPILVLNNLANVLRDEGHLALARPLYERVLAVRERVLGPDHTNTARTVHDLALLLREEGELAAARRLFERALAVRERVFGPTHYVVAASLHDLAGLLRDQGDPAAARRLLERALSIRERVLGTDHPDTVATCRSLAELAAEARYRPVR